MPSLMNVLKNPPARNGATSIIKAVANIPDSGTPSANNSLGASAATGEVLPYLDGCLDDLPSENFSSQTLFVERQLIARAKQYSNAGLPNGVGVAWNPDSQLLDLVSVSLQCSIDVYNEKSGSKPAAPGFSFSTVHSIAASQNGVSKTTKFFQVSELTNNPYFPALVIAVRGTFKLVDWLVNFNAELRDAKELLSFTDEAVPGLEKVKVHSGFLNGVTALLADIKAQIAKCIASSTIKHIVFTGHSAGGAVSSLAYLAMLGIAKTQYPNIRFSLVTFGCPPVTGSLLTDYITDYQNKQSTPGVALALLNEHDFVARVDLGYVKSVIDMYRPINDVKTGISQPRSRQWKLPIPDMYSIGTLIVLKDMNAEGDEREIKAFKLKPEELARLLFCTRSMHSKLEYDANVTQLKMKTVEAQNVS